MKCDAELHMADDFGDNHATIKCQLEAEHDGQHQKQYQRKDLSELGVITILWSGDEQEDED